MCVGYRLRGGANAGRLRALLHPQARGRQRARRGAVRAAAADHVRRHIQRQGPPQGPVCAGSQCGMRACASELGSALTTLDVLSV